MPSRPIVRQGHEYAARSRGVHRRPQAMGPLVHPPSELALESLELPVRRRPHLASGVIADGVAWSDVGSGGGVGEHAELVAREGDRSPPTSPASGVLLVGGEELPHRAKGRLEIFGSTPARSSRSPSTHAVIARSIVLRPCTVRITGRLRPIGWVRGPLDQPLGLESVQAVRHGGGRQQEETMQFPGRHTERWTRRLGALRARGTGPSPARASTTFAPCAAAGSWPGARPGP